MVSVVIPVYNNSAYLRQCVDSVLAQSRCLSQVVLVDDGSTDASPAICDEYAAGDSRVTVIHKANGGVSSAINAGLDAASAPWVMIVDSDDALWTEALATLCRAADESHCDVVAPRYTHYAECLGAGSLGGNVVPADVYTADCLLQRPGTDNCMAGKLVSRRIFSNLRFREGTRYEDLDIFYRVYQAAGTVCAVDAVTYFYRLNPHGFMLSGGAAHTDVLPVAERIVEWSKGRGWALESAAADRLFAAACTALSCAESEDMSRHAWETVCSHRRRVVANRQSRPKNRVAALLSYLGRRIFTSVLGRLR